MLLPGIPRYSQKNWTPGQIKDIRYLWDDIARVINSNAGSSVILVVTHTAHGTDFPASSYPTGTLLVESDRNALYVVEDVSGTPTWVLVSAFMMDLVAARPADLGANDEGFLFYATDQSSVYVWTGAAWDTITRRILFGSNFVIFSATLTADRTLIIPDAGGNVPVLPTAATTETGSGAIVRTTSPTLVTPTIGDFTNAQHNHQNAAGGGQLSIAALSDLPTLASGVYTPTLTGVANVGASTPYECQYLRVGSTVTVSGRVDVDPTAAVSTQLGISLPIASNIGAPEDCAGTAFCPTIAGQGAAILGDAANNRAQMEWIAVDITNQPMYFTFTYAVI